MVVVDVLKTVFPAAIAAPSLMLVIHACMLALLYVSHPYLDNKHNFFALTISFAYVFIYSLVLTVALRIPAEPWMLPLLLVVNLVLPPLAILAGWYLNQRKTESMNAKLREATHTRAYLPLPQVQKKRKTIERHINEFTLRVLASWTWGVLIASVVAGGSSSSARLPRPPSPVSGHTARRILSAPTSSTATARSTSAIRSSSASRTGPPSRRAAAA